MEGDFLVVRLEFLVVFFGELEALSENEVLLLLLLQFLLDGRDDLLVVEFDFDVSDALDLLVDFFDSEGRLGFNLPDLSMYQKILFYFSHPPLMIND